MGRKVFYSMKEFLLDAIEIMKQFILGQLLIALLNGLIAGLGFWALGIPQAVWLGALAGLCSLIPVVGPLLGFLPAVILAWTSNHSFWNLLGVAGVWALVQILESLVWQPKILGGKLNISPWLVIPILFFGGLFLGVFGVVFAIPMVAIAQAAYKRIRGAVEPAE